MYEDHSCHMLLPLTVPKAARQVTLWYWSQLPTSITTAICQETLQLASHR
jgi:hypothetical protein